MFQRGSRCISVCLALCLYQGLAYFRDRHHLHRGAMSECADKGLAFSCKAGHRPVQKAETDFRPAVLNYCPHDGYTPTAFPKGNAECCFRKDVCLASCGIAFETCWKQYYKCAERGCERIAYEQSEAAGEHGDIRSLYESSLRECKTVAEKNDANNIHINGQVVKHGGDHGDTSDSHEELVCRRFRTLQQQVCDCVPSDMWDRALKKRVEDFFRIHDLKQLNKKGELKNMKLWKSYKGKRPDMMQELLFNFNASLDIHEETDDDPELPSEPDLPSREAEL